MVAQHALEGGVRRSGGFDRPIVVLRQELLFAGARGGRLIEAVVNLAKLTGRLLRTEVAGDLREIGLLREVACTATVLAFTDTTLLAPERHDFLQAVTGVSEARTAADEVVSRRLGV